MFIIWKIIFFENLLGGFYENYKMNDEKYPKYFFYLFDYEIQFQIMFGYWHPYIEREKNNLVIFRNTGRREELFNFFTGSERHFNEMNKDDFEQLVKDFIRLSLKNDFHYAEWEIDSEKFIDFLSFDTNPNTGLDWLLFDYYDLHIKEETKL